MGAPRDARQGQWLSPDPILADYMLGNVNGGVHWPAQLGLYTFVANNPLKFSDLNGKEIWLVGDHSDAMLATLIDISGLPLIIGKHGKVEIAEGPPAPNRSAGARLVGGLIESKQVVFLKGQKGKGTDKSSTAPVSVDDAVDNIPTDVSVTVDIRENSKTKLLVKGEKGTELEQPSVAVKTAHELAHAESLTSGTLQNGTTTRSYVDEHGKLREEQVKHDEVKAIHRENEVRRERGMREREAYIHRETQ